MSPVYISKRWLTGFKVSIIDLDLCGALCIIPHTDNMQKLIAYTNAHAIAEDVYKFGCSNTDLHGEVLTHIKVIMGALNSRLFTVYQTKALERFLSFLIENPIMNIVTIETEKSNDATS